MRPIIAIGREEVRHAAPIANAGFIHDCGPRHIQMIEGVPCPQYMQIGIQNDDHVSDDIDSTGTLDVCHHLFHRRQRDNVPVGQAARRVVKHADLAFAKRGQL